MPGRNPKSARAQSAAKPLVPAVALLTGGDDKSYAMALALSLAEIGAVVDFVASDKLDDVLLRQTPAIRFLNLRGDQSEDASFLKKVSRLGRYYLRLMRYSVVAQPRLFHILWNNKIEWFDRTLLMLCYKACRRKVVLTAHNVNAGKRDGRDGFLNRITLKVQYRLADHLFVHTQKMKEEVCDQFGVAAECVTVIPFGINNTTSRTSLSGAEARSRLGIASASRVLLFFGQIAPYKGLEYLVEALDSMVERAPDTILVIAGKVKQGSEGYWLDIARAA